MMSRKRAIHPTSKEGLRNTLTGEDRSFRHLYDRIAGRMYHLCLRYAGNTEDASDWFQEGFIKLYRHLSSFRAEGSFEGWARKIFVGACIDGIKKRNLLFPVIQEGLDAISEDLTGYNNLTNEDLIKLIRQLPNGHRTIVNLFLVEGYSHKEIGEMLNISEEGSRSQLFRTRAALQKILSENGQRPKE